MTYLFLETDKLVGRRIDASRVLHYEFNTINGILNVIGGRRMGTPFIKLLHKSEKSLTKIFTNCRKNVIIKLELLFLPFLMRKASK